MFRVTISVFLALVFSANVLYNGAVYLNFLLNRSIIVELFCVNQNEPEIQCNGSCHLKDQLVHESNDDEKNAPIEFRFEVITAVTNLNESNKFVWFVVENKKLCVELRTKLPDVYLKFETPPPQCA